MLTPFFLPEKNSTSFKYDTIYMKILSIQNSTTFMRERDIYMQKYHSPRARHPGM